MKKAVRLDKFLADAGAGTRSEVKKYIQKGKVQVNGVPAKKPEIKVSEEDEVVLDGNRISQAPEFVYYLLHKPAGYVSATEDKRDKTVMELVASDRKGLFPVGRLDKDTEGLLLITDDGALAHELAFSEETCGQDLLCGYRRMYDQRGCAALRRWSGNRRKKSHNAGKTGDPQYKKS